MMERRITRQVEPVDAKPAGWNEGWEFPPKNTWPPGWPNKLESDYTIEHSWDGDLLTIECLDQYREPFDATGDLLCVNSNKRLKIRNHPKYVEELLIAIREFEPGRFGIRAAIDPEIGSVHLSARVFGKSNSPMIVWGL
jgi:hypothetical protein